MHQEQTENFKTMAFLAPADLTSVIRQYQLDAITDGDDTIIPTAIRIALNEVSNIFTPNNMVKWMDGRPIYDIKTVLLASGTDRDDFILVHTKVIALWHLILLCNTGLNYGEVKDRYDRSKADLIDLADGTTNSATLPQIVTVPADTVVPFTAGCNRKFCHGNS